MSQDQKRPFEDKDNQDDIRQIYKQIYEENQKKLDQQVLNAISIQQEESKVPQVHFKDGTYICNTLTQYPKEDLRDYMYSFRELLYEKPRDKNPEKTLLSVLMTTYGFEHELLEPIVKNRIKLLLINDNTSDKNHDIIDDTYLNYPNWKLVQPAKKTEGVRFVGAFHPKIWILKFPKFIRIVIGSQNLHIGDWTVWAQGMWVQDFPLAKNFKPQGSDLEFKNMLSDYLTNILPKKVDFQKELDIKMDDYLFQNIQIRLVCSIPSTFKGNQMYQYGSTRVLNIVYEELKKNQLGDFKNPIITYQATSLGDINFIFIDQLTNHFTGRQQKRPLDQQSLKQSFQKEPTRKSEFRLIFPTEDYIKNQTHAGVDFATTLFLRLDAYKKPTFPKNIFYRFEGSDYYPSHAGAIPHIKFFIVTESDQEITDTTVIYIGSHNLSYGAWGKLEKDDSQLNICNTELGVLYPPGKNTALIKKEIIKRLVFKFPPEKYNSDKPFIQELVINDQ